MTTLIISPGKKHPPELLALIGEYEKRLSGRFDIEWKFIPADNKEKESAVILKSIKPGDFVILLDEKGNEQTSVEFSNTMDQVTASGSKRLVFVIGGAYGVHDEIKKKARLTMSLSAMTLPHLLVRLLLVEQIYRASEILRGGQYHH
ncbi:MAG: 23S rRNA (pseudouridine(1915)-N(3))-methyltransferase RlmH [Patescibacteria group bacterium]|nr:23S rRNA (pseudouridine(1915)-N(3))-methyltransferase RlmH [Patescibacteria group bacterium]